MCVAAPAVPQDGCNHQSQIVFRSGRLDIEPDVHLISSVGDLLDVVSLAGKGCRRRHIATVLGTSSFSQTKHFVRPELHKVSVAASMWPSSAQVKFLDEDVESGVATVTSANYSSMHTLVLPSQWRVRLLSKKNIAFLVP